MSGRMSVTFFSRRIIYLGQDLIQAPRWVGLGWGPNLGGTTGRGSKTLSHKSPAAVGHVDPSMIKYQRKTKSMASTLLIQVP